MAIARSCLVNDGVEGTFHCISHIVRRHSFVVGMLFRKKIMSTERFGSASVRKNLPVFSSSMSVAMPPWEITSM